MIPPSALQPPPRRPTWRAASRARYPRPYIHSQARYPHTYMHSRALYPHPQHCELAIHIQRGAQRREHTTHTHIHMRMKESQTHMDQP